MRDIYFRAQLSVSLQQYVTDIKLKTMITLQDNSEFMLIHLTYAAGNDECMAR